MASSNDNTETLFRHLEAHRYASAVKLFEQITDPSPLMVWWRSICHFAMGKFDLALKDTTLLLDIDESHNRACLNMALIRASAPDKHLRDGKDAAYFMTRFVALHDGEMTWRILSIRAAVHAEQNNFTKAIEYSRMSLECAPLPMSARCKSRLSQYKQMIPFRSSAESIREGLLFRELSCVKCGKPAIFYVPWQGEQFALCCDCNWGTPEIA